MSAFLNIPGTYTVVYAPAQINHTIEGFSPNQIKEQLSTRYKELEKATISVSGSTVTFSIPSGQKN